MSDRPHQSSWPPHHYADPDTIFWCAANEKFGLPVQAKNKGLVLKKFMSGKFIPTVIQLGI